MNMNTQHFEATGEISEMSYEPCAIVTDETQTQAGLNCKLNDGSYHFRVFFGEQTVTTLPAPIGLLKRIENPFLEEPFEKLTVHVAGYVKDDDVRAIFVETLEVLD